MRTRRSGNPLARSCRRSRRRRSASFTFHGRLAIACRLVRIQAGNRETRGKPLPPSVLGRNSATPFIRPDAAVMGTVKFERYGNADARSPRCCRRSTRSWNTHLPDQVGEDPDQFKPRPGAEILFKTGFSPPGRPCIGSWALYGLGAEDAGTAGVCRMSTGQRPERGRAILVERLHWPTLYTGCRPVPRTKGDRSSMVVASGRGSRLQRDPHPDLSARSMRKRLADGRAIPSIATRIRLYERASRLPTQRAGFIRPPTPRSRRGTLAIYGLRDPEKAVFGPPHWRLATSWIESRAVRSDEHRTRLAGTPKET